MFSPLLHGSILACLGKRLVDSKWRPEVGLSINQLKIWGVFSLAFFLIHLQVVLLFV